MLTERCERHPSTQTRLNATIAELIVRVQAEYNEMPGLKLTEGQAQRLWGLDQRACGQVLRALVERHFLKRTLAGTFVRMTD